MTTRVDRRAGLATAALVVAMIAASPAQAQYFGRNKVQYKRFAFQVLQTEHFDIYFYPEERAAVAELARMAERWYTRLRKVLEHDLSTRQPIVVYASAPDFRQTNVVAGEIGEGTGGVTEGFKRRIVLPLAGTLAETDHVLGHELVHAFQYDIARTDPGRSGAGGGIEQLPLWFIEGLAEYLSIGPVDPHTAMWIRDAAREGGRLPAIRQLDNPEFFPYRWGQALWAFVAGEWGDAVIRPILDEALRAGSAQVGFEKVLGLDEKAMSARWHEAVRAQYRPVLAATERASRTGRALTAEDRSRGALAVSPALSPDGTRIAYLSGRDLLSIDLYLADAESGRVLRKLVDTATDPHFSSLQFIASAGAWHPRGREFAFGAVRQGRPVLAIVDVGRGRRVREIAFPQLGEILNPTWSPDARAIAFSATAGGQSDLFVYDLQTAELRRLTDDLYADLQPAWSPDGRRIAFATDRFTTDLSRLAPGPIGLAVIDVASGRIERLPVPAGGKAINPQWAPDGRRLYFLSDATGITNLYAVELVSGEVRRLTNLDAGATGITELSPALTVALDANRLAFSGYEEGRIGIYVLDGSAFPRAPAAVTEAPAAMPSGVERAAAVLPPTDRDTDDVPALLKDAAGGLPEKPGTEAPYRSRLSLDAVGRPYVAAGIDRFGPVLGGGLAFSLSDMLGNHTLFTAVDVSSYGGLGSLYKNTGLYAVYSNLTHRWNWSLSGGQVPYLSGGYAAGVGVVGGQAAYVEQEVIYRQTYRGLGGAVAYPFDEARRIEVGGGYQQVALDQETHTVATSLRTGRSLLDDTRTSSLAAPLHLGSASVAFVTDSALFGATSPVAGQRGRVEIAPTVGSLSFTSVLGDYRRYAVPVRFYTVATRILHYGRYGPGAEHPLLAPLFLGYPELVRGYGLGSFRASECAPGPAGSCEAFDRLLGSRLLVANLELRFPLLRPFVGVGRDMYGPLPLEVALFADGGVAWTRGERPSFLGGDRRPVSSAGLTLRANLFGFAVAQLDLAYPFQRPGRGWVWAISLTPGF
ncbi:MAG TPA: BamA/TamA family outer membrane protein [Vicinamibacterales bacterium]|nr:BamA/TamA family outer membrane protein [Vicinamibacterales bacterium]